jgi:NADPH2:quinone reductase
MTSADLPSTATVVQAPAYGGPEVLEVVRVPLAAPGPGEATVQVRAVGVNPIDWKSYSGVRGADPAALPLGIGFELAGVVIAAGPGVSLVPGDEVLGFRVTGAYASYVVVPEPALVRKPAGLGWPEAGGLLLAGVTAVHALTVSELREGETVLVHGAAGGVGLLAVQLAKLRGARVIGTASAHNHERLRELGVEPVAYGDGLIDRVRALAPDGVDVALDLVGSDEAYAVSAELVPEPGRVVTIAGFGKPDMGFRVLGMQPGAEPGHDIRAAARSEVAQLAADGKLVFPVRSRPLAEAADAHREGMEGHTVGKVVLVP